MKKLTVLFATVAMVATFAMTAAAAEWNFYGSARVNTFWFDQDLATGSPNGAGDNDDSGLTAWGIQGNSRIGAHVKVSDTLSGRFEYGTGVNVRLLWGKWTFGAGSLYVGQMYTPLDQLISNQVFDSDNDLIGYGAMYNGRQGGIKLVFGGFQLGLYSADTDALGTAGDVDQWLPIIEASYHLSLGKAYLDFFGGYQSYEIETVGRDYDVDSYLVGFGAGVNLGMFYVKSTAWLGQNIAPLNAGSAVVVLPTVNAITGRYDDNDAFGLVLVAGVKVNDMVTIEAGGGYIEAESDAAGSREDDAYSVYVNATVNLAPGVFIVPEIGILDLADDDNGVDQGDTVYYGLKWQINF